MSLADYEWDESKRERNLKKHGIDFYDAVTVFDDKHLTTVAHFEGETRFVSLGLMNSLVVAVVWTDREGRKRLISARVARRNERQAYHARFGS